MKKRTAFLGVVGVGLAAVAIGFGWGALETGVEWLVEQIFGLFGLKPPPAQDSKGLTRSDWLIIGAVGMGLGALLLALTLSDRSRRRRTRRALRRAFQTDQLLGDAYATRDGKYAIVGVKVRSDLWGPTHKLYHQHTFGTTASLAEPDHEYRFIIASIENGELKPFPVEQHAAPASQMDVVLGLGGGSRVWWTFWKGLHTLFSEVKVPLLTTFVTGVSVFFMAAVEAPVGERMKAYFHEQFHPWLVGRKEVLASPPKPLKFQALHAEVWTAKRGPKLDFAESLLARPRRQIPDRINDFRMIFSIAGFRSMKYARPISGDD